MASAQDEKKSRFKVNKKVTVFTICVAVASVFWLLNALSKSYIMALAIPLDYTEIPEGYAITNQPPSYVQVRVEGDGFNLLSLDDAEHEPVPIQTRDLFAGTGALSYKAVVATKDLQRQLQEELGSSVSILGVSHDSLQLSIERLASVKIPVKLNTQISLKNGFTIANQIITPDSIQVQGPVSTINQLNELGTDTIIRSEVAETFNAIVGVQLPSRFMQTSPEQVNAEIIVEPLTEGKIDVPIRVLHAPDSVRVMVYPSKVKLVFTVPLSQFDKITDNQFTAYVDYLDITNNNPAKLKVAWGSKPDHVTLLNYSPKRVEYIIQKQ